MRSVEYSLSEKLIMFTQDGCGACEAVKKKLKKAFREGKIVEYNLKNKKVRDLAIELGIVATPTFASVKGQEVCVLDSNLNPIVCRKVKHRVIL